MARDLREIMVAIRVASDLERIGDLAKNTRQAHPAMSGPAAAQADDAASTRMGRLALAAAQERARRLFALAMPTMALEVWRSDEEIDALYNSLFRELLTYMMEDPRNISAVHASAVRRQEHRAHRRPRHQHRREHLLPGPRQAARRGAPEEGRDQRHARSRPSKASEDRDERLDPDRRGRGAAPDPPELQSRSRGLPGAPHGARARR